MVHVGGLDLHYRLIPIRRVYRNASWVAGKLEFGTSAPFC
jgi:hypothetical protein